MFGKGELDIQSKSTEATGYW